MRPVVTGGEGGLLEGVEVIEMAETKDIAGTLRLERVGRRRVVHDLLDNIAIELAFQARRYFEASGWDRAFAYNESQFHSLMMPAVHRLCPVVFREQPVRRTKGRGGKGRGQLDYWLEVAERITMIELKHVSLSVRQSRTEGGQVLHTDARTVWASCQEQVRSLRSVGARSVMSAGWTADVVGLVVCCWYAKVPDETTLPAFDAQAAHRQVVTELSELVPRRGHRIGWHGLWTVPEDMSGPDEVRTNRKVTWYRYPAVSYVAALAPVFRK